WGFGHREAWDSVAVDGTLGTPLSARTAHLVATPLQGFYHVDKRRPAISCPGNRWELVRTHENHSRCLSSSFQRSKRSRPRRVIRKSRTRTEVPSAVARR